VRRSERNTPVEIIKKRPNLSYLIPNIIEHFDKDVTIQSMTENAHEAFTTRGNSTGDEDLVKRKSSNDPKVAFSRRLQAGGSGVF
jgi:hypothetical protein